MSKKTFEFLQNNTNYLTFLAFLCEQGRRAY